MPPGPGGRLSDPAGDPPGHVGRLRPFDRRRERGQLPSSLIGYPLAHDGPQSLERTRRPRLDRAPPDAERRGGLVLAQLEQTVRALAVALLEAGRARRAAGCGSFETAVASGDGPSPEATAAAHARPARRPADRRRLRASLATIRAPRAGTGSRRGSGPAPGGPSRSRPARPPPRRRDHRRRPARPGMRVPGACVRAPRRRPRHHASRA